MRKKMTKDQSRDTGMAMVLLLLILYVSLKWKGLYSLRSCCMF